MLQISCSKIGIIIYVAIDAERFFSLSIMHNISIIERGYFGTLFLIDAEHHSDQKIVSLKMHRFISYNLLTSGLRPVFCTNGVFSV